MSQPDAGARVAPDGADAWIDVARGGERTYATVNLQGGAVSSRWHVSSLREVQDIAARYGIPRGEIRVEPGAFDPAP